MAMIGPVSMLTSGHLRYCGENITIKLDFQCAAHVYSSQVKFILCGRRIA